MASIRTSQSIQSKGFRATGKGYFNQLPNFAANQSTGNAVLENTALAEGDPLRKLYLFCTAVTTGWTIGGSFGQTLDSRAFYPRGLTQNDLEIRCQVASQYEYDRLVDFIQQHHASTIGTLTPVEGNRPKSAGGVPLEFKLFRYEIPVGIDARGNRTYRLIHDSMHYQGFVPSIPAGHERFINAPEFTIPFKVSNDFIGGNIVQTGMLNRELTDNYLRGFGRLTAESQAALDNRNLIEQSDSSWDGARPYTDREQSFWAMQQGWGQA